MFHRIFFVVCVLCVAVAISESWGSVEGEEKEDEEEEEEDDEEEEEMEEEDEPGHFPSFALTFPTPASASLHRRVVGKSAAVNEIKGAKNDLENKNERNL